MALAKLSGGASYVPGAGPTFLQLCQHHLATAWPACPPWTACFCIVRVQSDVLLRDKGNVFKVVRPVSYRPGAGYFWKYLVPRKLFPLLLLPRPPVPKTGSGILLCAGVCPAAELRQLGYLPTLREPPWQASFLRRTAKTIVGLSLMELNLQMARGGWRSRAALY